MISTKPTLLLVHGAFGTPASWDKLVPFLKQGGYPIKRATYPSANPEKPSEAAAKIDIQYVRDRFLLPLIEQEHKDVVVIVHSFGGIVGGGAAVGLSKTDRLAQNLEGGVLGLIYIAGNITHEKQTMFDSVGGQWPPWLKLDNPGEGKAIIEPLFEMLCHDCDPSLESEINAEAVPQGYSCFTSEVPAQSWAEKGFNNRLAYIRTANDKINPAFAQDMWIEGTGVKWDLATMETSHAPYLSQPQQLARHILDFSAKFEAL